MVKIIIAFVVFSAGALFLLMQGGDINMAGESHGIDASHAEKPAAAAPSAAAAPATK
jgi:hypothetical protein